MKNKKVTLLIITSSLLVNSFVYAEGLNLLTYNEINNYINPNEKFYIDRNLAKRNIEEISREELARKEYKLLTEQEKSELPWSTWYRKAIVPALLSLAKIRENLESHNLFDNYVELPKNIHCSKIEIKSRTADGRCNDLESTAMGMAGIRFGRNTPTYNIHFPKNDQELLTPNPRLISKELLTRKEFKEVPFLNLLAANWIQFMVHDWVNHLPNEYENPIYVTYPKGDELGKGMILLRSDRDPSLTNDERKILSERVYKNEVTHWWDGSQIYGSNIETQQKLRLYKNGLMKIDGDTLPLDSIDNKDLTGFKRNWWVGLQAMHTIFVKEHNSIANMLKKKYKNMSDEELFNKARLINTALMAKIHTVEWTPAILPNKTLRAAMHANWYGLGSNSKHTKAWLDFFNNHVVNGIVGNHKDLSNVPFTLTEEFVSVYRLHSLLPDSVQIHSHTNNILLKNIPLVETTEDKALPISKKMGMTDMLYSFGTSHPGQLVLNNFPKFMQNLSVPLMGNIDLGAVDIIRDRERGVPRYNEFRQVLGLKPIKNFEDLTSDEEVVKKLKTIYENDVNKIDLLIGTLAESTRPTGYGFGETQFQIFILMASRRLKADRFFTTDYNKETYTQEGLNWIDHSSFKDVILRHHPELKMSLYGVVNAFNPWNVAGKQIK